jgi:hypothetical protein
MRTNGWLDFADLDLQFISISRFPNADVGSPSAGRKCSTLPDNRGLREALKTEFLFTLKTPEAGKLIRRLR